MKKIVSVLLVFVLLFQITVPVSAATVVSKDKAPNYDIWLANSFLNGLDNKGEGIYKTFRGFQAPIYQVLGGELLKDKPLVSMSTAWTIFFNSEYRNQFANEQKYIYEVVLMDYLKYGSSVKTAEEDLLGNEFKFEKKLYEVLAKDLGNNTIDYIDKELSVDDAVKIWKNAKVITNLDEALEEADDGKTSVKDLIEELSRYSALLEAKESKISLLKASRNAAGDNVDYKKAVDDIIKAIERTKLNYVRNRSLNYLWNKFLDEGWEKLLDINPVLKAIDLGVSSLDMCFDTTNSASNNLKLAVLYNVDCYMAMGMMKARETYSQRKSASNARIFKECFEGYIQFQMFGNTYADKWLSQYLSGGAIKDLFNQIFHKENIKTAKDMQKLAQSQITTRQRLLEIMNQYAGIYKGKYPIVKGQSIKNSIKLSVSTLKLTPKQTYMLKVTVRGNSNRVTWRSSNSAVASVSSRGKVTAKKSGTSTITATANGVSARCKVIVRSKTNAASLYKRFLEKRYTYVNKTTIYGEPRTKLNLDYFCIVDINKDGSDELLIREMRSIGDYKYLCEELNIFTIVNKQVKYAGSWLHGTLVFNKKYGGIQVYHSGTGYGGDSLISLKNGKSYQKIYLYGYEDYNRGWRYFFNNEKNEITKKQYDRYFEKYFGNKNDIKKIKYSKNNKINRNSIK